MNNEMFEQEKFKLFLTRKGLKASTIKGDVEVLTRLINHTTLDRIDEYLLELINNKRRHSYINNIATPKNRK